MYVVIVYDIGVDRVNKVKAFLRQYADWHTYAINFRARFSFYGMATVRLEKRLAKIHNRCYSW